jgi:hypothetical protein
MGVDTDAGEHMSKIWIIGHGELGQQETFVPDGMTLVYYVKNGFINPFSSGLSELSTDGAVTFDRLGEQEVFESITTYYPTYPTEDSEKPLNHRLGAFTDFQQIAVDAVRLDPTQELLWAGLDFAHLTPLCTEPGTCAPPSHSCTGLLADARLAGREVHLISCRGVVTDSMGNTPPVLLDEPSTAVTGETDEWARSAYGTNYIYDTCTAITQAFQQEGTARQGYDMLYALTEAERAMTLAVSPDLRNFVARFEQSLALARSATAWLDPVPLAKGLGKEPWQAMSKRATSVMERAWCYAAGRPWPRVEPGDCPKTFSSCLDRSWSGTFHAWLCSHYAANDVTVRALGLIGNKAQAVTSLYMAAAQNEDLSPGEVVFAVNDLQDHLGPPARALKWGTTLQALTKSADQLQHVASFTSQDVLAPTHELYPRVRDGLTAAQEAITSVVARQDRLHKEFVLALTQLDPDRDIVFS